MSNKEEELLNFTSIRGNLTSKKWKSILYPSYDNNKKIEALSSFVENVGNRNLYTLMVGVQTNVVILGNNL